MTSWTSRKTEAEATDGEPSRKKRRDDSSTGISSVSSLADFKARFPDAKPENVHETDIFRHPFSLDKQSIFSLPQTRDVLRLLHPDIVKAYCLLPREDRNTTHLSVIALLDKLLRVLRLTPNAPRLEELRNPLATAEQCAFECDEESTKRRRDEYPGEKPTGSVEFVIRNCDRIGLVITVVPYMTSTTYHRNPELWQLVGELYAACLMNKQIKNDRSERYVYGALTSFTVWVFVRARINKYGVFIVHVSKKITAVTEQESTVDVELGAIQLLSYLTEALRLGFDDAPELHPDCLAGAITAAEDQLLLASSRYMDDWPHSC